jgi:hypothetical protein
MRARLHEVDDFQIDVHPSIEVSKFRMILTTSGAARHYFYE